MLSFLLVRLYTGILPTAEYGEVSIVLSWMVFFNVILSYGMETAFFRFYSAEDDKKNVIATSTISIFWSSIDFCLRDYFLGTHWPIGPKLMYSI